MRYQAQRDKDRKHAKTLLRKRERIAGLYALKETHEQAERLDRKYLRELTARIRSAEQNLAAMKVEYELE